MARSRAKARLTFSSQGQRLGRCRVSRRAERVSRPARAKNRRLRVLVVTMERAAFERVYEAFLEFHAFFAGAFGRKQWREHSRHYLQGLLVQAQERRNAENLSEMVPVSARAMQRLLTD